MKKFLLLALGFCMQSLASYHVPEKITLSAHMDYKRSDSKKTHESISILITADREKEQYYTLDIINGVKEYTETLPHAIKKRSS